MPQTPPQTMSLKGLWSPQEHLNTMKAKSSVKSTLFNVETTPFKGGTDSPIKCCFESEIQSGS
jgi:hypothetical protein